MEDLAGKANEFGTTGGSGFLGVKDDKRMMELKASRQTFMKNSPS